MLKINKEDKTLSALDKVTLPDSGITERYDLQAMIRNCPEAFFNEMNEQLLLIGEEVRPANIVGDRIDLLTLDRDGACVIIELKRGNYKLQLLQAISYAAMISDWQAEDIVIQYQSFVQSDEAKDTIEAFITEDIESVNSSQRIILIAEGFDYEVLASAEWLTEHYGVDIKCFRLTVACESNGNEYMNCTCIFRLLRYLSR